MARTWAPGTISGYIVKKDDKFRFATEGGSLVAGNCVRTGVSRIRPGAPGSWISSTRESFRCLVGGKQYVGRNYGVGMFINLRPSKKPRAGVAFAGAHRKTRRRS